MTAARDARDDDSRSVRVRELGAADEPAWDRFVASCPDGTFFHTTAWRDVVREVFEFPPHYLLCEGHGGIAAVLPLSLVPGGLLNKRHLVSVPFGVYGGLCGADPRAREALAQAARRLAAENRAAFVELRHLYEPLGALPTKTLYVTYRKELPDDPEACLQRLPRKARAAARKGLNTFGLDAGPVDPTDATVDAFFQLFALNKRHLGSPTLPRRFFQTVLRVLGDRAFLFMVRHGGEPVAAVLSLVDGDTLIAYYAGVLPGAERMNVSNVMYAKLMAHGVERGLKVFDFCRSRSDSGAARFKEHQGFEPRQLHYEYLLGDGVEMPDVSPSNPRYDLFRKAWMRLPLGVTKWLGPRLIRYLP